jgi:hypothetical protein
MLSAAFECLAVAFVIGAVIYKVYETCKEW